MELKKIVENPIIELENGSIKFEIDQHTDSFPKIGQDELVIKTELDGKESEHRINPKNYSNWPYMKEDRMPLISVVQVIPRDEEGLEYRLIMGTDNNCCYGALFYINLALNKEDGGFSVNDRLINGKRMPFNIVGVLGTDETVNVSKGGGALVYGQGCAGRGIRLVDFGDATSKAALSENQAKEIGEKIDLFAKPYVREGELFIPANYSFDSPCSIDQKVRENLDDHINEHVLPSIKETVAKSRIIYAPK